MGGSQGKKAGLLWEGKVTQRKNILSSRTRYAWVYKDSLVIRKKSTEDSKLLVEIPRGNLVSVNFPQFGALEALITGFKGFIVKYREKEEGKVKTVSFWAKGFGAYPSQQEMKKLTSAMAEFAGEDPEKVAESAGAYSFTKYMFVVAPMLAGYFFAGLFGFVIMGVAGFGAMVVYEKKDMGQGTKTALVAGILGGGCVITFIIALIIGFSIGLLQQQ